MGWLLICMETQNMTSVKDASNSKKMKDNPAKLSDRALNDIYIFKNGIDASLIRYFGLDVHDSIISS